MRFQLKVSFKCVVVQELNKESGFNIFLVSHVVIAAD